MNNKKLALSILMISMVAVLATAGTWASFSDNKTSTGNTFTAGNLSLALSNDGTNYGNSVTGTWSMPINMKPGDSVTGTIHATNKGTVGAKDLNFYIQNVIKLDPGQDSDIGDKIILTSVKETFGTYTTGEEISGIMALDKNGDGKISLNEFENPNFYFTTNDLVGNEHKNNGFVIAAGDHNDYSITFTFKFLDDSDNKYQGDSNSFDMRLLATQNSPNEGALRFHL